MTKKMTEEEFKKKTGMTPKEALDQAGSEMERMAPSRVKALADALLPEEEKERLAKEYRAKG